MLLETFWWRWNFQTGSHNTARFFPLPKCLSECLFFQFTYLICMWTGTWSMPMTTGFQNIWISFFPVAKSPNLEESLFCSCWILPTDLFFGICQSPDEGEDSKTDLWDQNWRRFLPSYMYHIYYWLTFAHVYVLLSYIRPCAYVRYPHIRSCMWYCSLTFAHVCASLHHIRLKSQNTSRSNETRPQYSAYSSVLFCPPNK